MRLLTYNIREGGVGRAEQIAEVISAANPDVVALQEARHPKVVEQIATLAGYPFCGSRPLHSTAVSSTRSTRLMTSCRPRWRWRASSRTVPSSRSGS